VISCIFPLDGEISQRDMERKRRQSRYRRLEDSDPARQGSKEARLILAAAAGRAETGSGDEGKDHVHKVHKIPMFTRSVVHTDAVGWTPKLRSGQRLCPSFRGPLDLTNMETTDLTPPISSVKYLHFTESIGIFPAIAHATSSRTCGSNDA
jgi:hypothetical protein